MNTPTEQEKIRAITVFYKAVHIALDAGFSVNMLQNIVLEVAHDRTPRV